MISGSGTGFLDELSESVYLYDESLVRDMRLDTSAVAALLETILQQNGTIIGYIIMSNNKIAEILY